MFIYIILSLIIALVVFVIFSGYVFHKAGAVDSTADGIVLVLDGLERIGEKVGACLRKAFHLLFERLRETNPQARLKDEALMPTTAEITDLISRLSGHPYDTPSREAISVNASDVFVLTIGACGLTQAYRDLSPQQLREMVCRIINEFFLDHRGTAPAFYVPYAASDRFALLIPLSPFGLDALKRKIEETQAYAAMSSPPGGRDQPLTEEAEVDPLDEGSNL